MLFQSLAFLVFSAFSRKDGRFACDDKFFCSLKTPNAIMSVLLQKAYSDQMKKELISGFLRICVDGREEEFRILHISRKESFFLFITISDYFKNISLDSLRRKNVQCEEFFSQEKRSMRRILFAWKTFIAKNISNW